MKKKTITTITLCILTFVIGFVFISVVFNGINQIPRIRIQNRIAGSRGHSVKALTEYIDENVMWDVSFLGDLEETRVKNHNVTPALINENFFKIQNIEVSGNDISKEDIENKNLKAIISDNLARKLFLTGNAVGKIFYMNHKKYMVSGVYREKSDLISTCSQDNKDRIFITYTAVDFENIIADTVLYKNTSDNVNISLFCAKDYRGTNLIQKLKVLLNFVHIFNATAYIFLLVIILKLITHLIKEIISLYKTELNYRYFFGVIQHNPKFIIIRLSAIIAGVAILITVFLLSDFSIYIPPRYMPPDNFFDASYYISKIIQASQEYNATKILGLSYYQQLYSTTFHTSFYLLTVFLIISIALYHHVTNSYRL